jgi:hypothetical protein
MGDLVDSEYNVLLFKFIDLSLLLHNKVGSQNGLAEIGGNFGHLGKSEVSSAVEKDVGGITAFESANQLVHIHSGCHAIVEFEPSFKQLRVLQSKSEIFSSREKFLLLLHLFPLLSITFFFLSFLLFLLLLLLLLPQLLLSLRARPIALPHQIPRKAVVVSSVSASPMDDNTVQFITEIDSWLMW